MEAFAPYCVVGTVALAGLFALAALTRRPVCPKCVRRLQPEFPPNGPTLWVCPECRTRYAEYETASMDWAWPWSH